jgi:hypothetical protein
MPKYQKKPVVIDAFRYNVDDRPDWFMDKVSDLSIITHHSFCQIMTLEGEMRGQIGDWIIRGVQGEIYPCKPDIFAATYQPVEE